MSITPTLFTTQGHAVQELGRVLGRLGQEVWAERWQGKEAPQPMLEVLSTSFRAPILLTRESLALDVNPNLPWADLHFEERVSRNPTNPGDTFHLWPYYPRGRDSDIRPTERFTHTYQERFWPKYAGELGLGDPPHRGIWYNYGDLDDVLSLLRSDPLTRQAFLPVWFPEDTGAVHLGRVPCTLGYWFVHRNGFLHCTYYIRSCDYFRHLRDDIYMAGRLVHWVLDQLNSKTPEQDRQVGVDYTWDRVAPGFLNMHIGSLHCWRSERGVLPK